MTARSRTTLSALTAMLVLSPLSAWSQTVPIVRLAPPNARLAEDLTATADRPEQRFDIVDRQGRVVQQLLLEHNQHIFAFGKNSVYVAVTDDDGLQRIQRHPWP